MAHDLLFAGVGRLGRRIGMRAGLLLATGLACPFAAQAATIVYTLDAHFDQGVLSGVNHDAPNNNQLQLSTVGTTFPVMWVANAGESTLSKIDTATGRELARYRTWFGSTAFTDIGAWSGPAPSRSAVDVEGNAYILNRHFDGGVPVLIKVLTEGFIDRNGNGVADTSIDVDNNGIISFTETKSLVDTNGNGVIDATEIQDERIAWATRVQMPGGPSEAGMLGRSMCIGTDGNLWVGMYNSSRYYKVRGSDGVVLSGPHPVGVTPYGCLIDGNGILWSASLATNISKLDTNNPASTATYNDGSSNNYGIALGNGKVYLASYSNWGFRQFDPATNTFSTPGGSKGFTSYGIAVDGSGNIWTGPANTGGVRKYNSAGTQLCSGAAQASTSDTRGVIVDADNNIWQISRATNAVFKFRGSDCAWIGVYPVGYEPYTYSDATGFAARNITSPTGTWTVINDSGANGQNWSAVSWNSTVPAGASVQVSTRAANDQASLAAQPYLPVANGANPGVTGRYIQVQARLNAAAGGASPVLYDLTLTTPSNVCDVDLDGDIDVNDLNLIRAAIGQTPGSNDSRDATGDGKITINDVRYCTLRCTKPGCAQ